MKINIENLSLSFENKAILNKIILNIADGETVVIFGKNGSGKSVLLKTIAGLITDYSGNIRIDGIDLREINRLDANTADEYFRIAYVFQKGGLFDSMNVFDNVAFAMRRKNIAENTIRDTVRNSLDSVGLSGNENKLISELSGGMQKRVGFARAMCSDPDIILYDDPTAGLDPILSDSISDIICEIKNIKKTTSLVVTHDLEVAKKIADEVVLLYDGRLVFSGSNYNFFNGNNMYAKQFIEGKLEGPIDIF